MDLCKIVPDTNFFPAVTAAYLCGFFDVFLFFEEELSKSRKKNKYRQKKQAVADGR